MMNNQRESEAASPIGETAMDENDIIIVCVDTYVANTNTKLSRQCNGAHRLGEEHCKYRRYHISYLLLITRSLSMSQLGDKVVKLVTD